MKTNYAIDNYGLLDYTRGNPPEWSSTDTMYIDYILVRQLDWDCDKNEIITNQLQLNSFDYAVKKSISITASQAAVKVNNTDKVTFRATDFFAITGPFQVDTGGEMTVIMQSCPN